MVENDYREMFPLCLKHFWSDYVTATYYGRATYYIFNNNLDNLEQIVIYLTCSNICVHEYLYRN